MLGKGKEKSVELQQPNGTAALHGWRGWMGGNTDSPTIHTGRPKKEGFGNILVLFWFGIFNSTGLEEERFCVVWYKIFEYEDTM